MLPILSPLVAAVGSLRLFNHESISSESKRTLLFMPLAVGNRRMVRLAIILSMVRMVTPRIPATFDLSNRRHAWGVLIFYLSPVSGFFRGELCAVFNTAYGMDLFLCGHVKVAHGGRRVGVSEDFLHGLQVAARAFVQSGREGVPGAVQRDAFSVNPGGPTGFPEACPNRYRGDVRKNPAMFRLPLSFPKGGKRKEQIRMNRDRQWPS